MNRDLLESGDVDVASLQQRIARERAERPASPEENERAARIVATTLRQADPIDPAVIAELYERPVAPPPFSGTELGRLSWFLRGPLRMLARLCFRLATVLDKRLQENRTEAFRRLTREVALLREEIAELRRDPAGATAAAGLPDRTAADSSRGETPSP